MFRHLRGYSPSIYSCWKLLVNLPVHLHVLTGPERVAPLEKKRHDSSLALVPKPQSTERMSVAAC